MSSDTFYAVTLAQSTCSKEHLEQAIISLGIDSYIIAQENHKDGGVHFHISIKKPKNSDLVAIRQSFEDILDPDAPINVQPCKKSRDWNRYCTKEDKHAIVCGINEEHINAYWKIWSCVFISPDLTMDHPYIVRNCRYRGNRKIGIRMNTSLPHMPRG